MSKLDGTDTKMARGKRAEEYVEKRLCDKGWSLRGRRVRCPYGEMDLIMIRDEEVLIVEVKSTRLDFGQPLSPKQRERLKRCYQWVQERTKKQVRITLALVSSVELLSSLSKNKLQPRVHFIEIE